jgi:hypothetical protein
LVGKLVRCKSCSNAFRLNADGVAEKVAEAVASLPVPESPPGPGSVPISSLPSISVPAKPAENRNSARLQIAKQQENLRKQMAANLAESMGKALETEAVKTEEKKVKSERIAKPGDDKKMKRSGRAILTGEGEREAENDRRWWLVGAGLLLAIAAIIWLATWENERARAVDAFAAEVPASQNRYGYRAQALLARAWIITSAPGRPPVQPAVAIDDLRLGSITTIPPSALGPLVRLKGLTLHRDLNVWCAENQVDAIQRKIAVGLAPETVIKELAKSGLDDGSVRVLDQLLHGVPAPDASQVLAALAGGEAPAIRWCEFRGPTATTLLDAGGSYRTRTGPYTGTLVSIGGSPWRVLEFAVNIQAGKP